MRFGSAQQKWEQPRHVCSHIIRQAAASHTVSGELEHRDRDRQGRLLVVHNDYLRQVMALGPGEKEEKELSVLDWPWLRLQC